MKVIRNQIDSRPGLLGDAVAAGSKFVPVAPPLEASPADRASQNEPARASGRARAAGRANAPAMHDQLQAVLESSLDAMIVFDDNWQILEVNPAACEFFAGTRESLCARTFDSLFAPADRQRFRIVWADFLRAGRRRVEREIHLSDGRTRIVETNSTANFVPGRHLSVMRDVTETRRAEESLHHLSQRLLTMQDDERRRIARELHDSTGQCLAATILSLEFVTREESALSPRARKALADAAAHATSCAAEVRTISYLLHPPLLDEAGLSAALQWFIRGYSERSGIAVRVDIPPDLDRLRPDLRTALFRIVQEGLTNIHRHSESATADLRVGLQDHTVVLEITDAGHGIDPQVFDPKDGFKNVGVGLAGMRERVRQLGGQLEIRSSRPGGTTILAKFPLEVTYGNSATAGS